MLETIIILGSSLLLAWPIGRFMAGIYGEQHHWSNRIFQPFESLLYRIFGINSSQGMSWKGYAKAFLWSNVIFGVIAFLIFFLQHKLPMNPDNIGPLSWDLALHTLISFLTNTNQQHYSGQAQLSYLSQTLGIVTLQVVTPMMAVAVLAAIIRGMQGGRHAEQMAEGETRDLGNYYVDLTRGILRLLLPLCFVTAIALAAQGVPSSYQGARTVAPLDVEAQVAEQKIPIGPVAAMVAIKQLGTNGGGWYGPNSTNPMENPTPISNAIETIAIILLPMATVFMAGYLLKRPKFIVLSLGVMGILSVVFIGAIIYSELQPNVAFSGLAAAGPNMEGKEIRFGPTLSALWATLTTQTSNGSVNAMHDSLNPLGGLVTRSGMLVNAVWGGLGCGFVNFLVYLWLTVFLAGLMIGRTPELYGRKIETNEITLLGALVVLPALIILGFTAITLATPAWTANSNPGLHGLAQVFYEYASAFANNGSGFEGLGDNTLWWNLSCVAVLLIGRYLPLVLPLIVAGYMAQKRVAPETTGTLKIENMTFALTLLVVILMINFLSFIPAAILGPIGEMLELSVQ